MAKSSSSLEKQYGANVNEIGVLAKKYFGTLNGVRFFRDDSKLLMNPNSRIIVEVTRLEMINGATLVFEDLKKCGGDLKLWTVKLLLCPNYLSGNVHFWESFVSNYNLSCLNLLEFGFI